MQPCFADDMQSEQRRSFTQVNVVPGRCLVTGDVVARGVVGETWHDRRRIDGFVRVMRGDVLNGSS